MKPPLIARLGPRSQMVLPKRVRARLGIGPGDVVQFVERDGCVVIEPLVVAQGEPDPFAAFTEWSSDADRRAYGDL